MKKAFSIFLLGLSLFSIFFGAGNILFPPYIGLVAKDQYLLASIGFILAGVGIPLSILWLIIKYDGDYIKYYSVAGKKFAILISILTFTFVGPVIAIPRTASTTYEISILPFFNINKTFIIILYFLIVYFFSYNKSKVVDYLGKILTPILVISLFVFIFKGFLASPNFAVNTENNHMFNYGIVQGYLTLDALGCGLFAALVWNSLKDKYNDVNIIKKYSKISIIICVMILAIVYFGLIYVTAKFSAIESLNSLNERSMILKEISKLVLGENSKFILSIIVSMTCLTTAIGLCTVGSTLINDFSDNKISYKFSLITIILISIFIGNFKLEKIISFSIPILEIMYPITILITIYGYLKNYLSDFTIKFSIYITFIYLIIVQIFKINVYNMFWILIAIISILVSIIYEKVIKKYQ